MLFPEALVSFHRALQSPRRAPRCEAQEAYLGVSWSFATLWAVLFVTWCAVIFWGCKARERKAMQWLMFIVPFFHVGDAIWQLFTYTHCKCMFCIFDSHAAQWAWVGSQYAFSIGRLTALILCIYLISTGAGTVRAWLLRRNYIIGVPLFGGFITATALGVPLSIESNGVDELAAFIASIVCYVLILIVVIIEATANCRVLKAQLLMIRSEGIDPRTCPAYFKFRLFTRLRRYIFGYFVMHTFMIVSQVIRMQLWQRILLLVIWELVQVALIVLVGWLFKASNTVNPFLEREAHLADEHVRRPLSAQEVTLGWDDLDRVAEDDMPTGAHAPLRAWDANMAVPAPPEAPPIISVLQLGGRRRRGSARTRPQTPTQRAVSQTRITPDEAAAQVSAQSAPAISVSRVAVPKSPDAAVELPTVAGTVTAASSSSSPGPKFEV